MSWPRLRLLAHAIPCATLLLPSLAFASSEPAEDASTEPTAEASPPPEASETSTPPSPAAASTSASMAAATAVDRKRFRLNLTTEVLGVNHANPVEDGMFTAELPNTTIFGFGAGRSGLRTQASPLTIVGFGFGYMINPQIIVGAEVFMMGGTLSVKGETAVGGALFEYKDRLSAFGGGLTPYVHYIFTTEGVFRPYAMFRFGFGAVRDWVYGENNSPTGTSSSQEISESVTPIVGLGGGVHVFVTDAVSLDVGLTLDYLAPYSRPVKTTTESSTGMTTTNKANADYNKVSNSVSFAIPLGISIWM